jgi:hypothetical protein
MAKVESGHMNNPESFAATSTLALHSEPPAPVFEAERDDLTVFFTIGVVINIVMITAYFIWAYKQWGKSGARALRQAQDDRE